MRSNLPEAFAEKFGIDDLAQELIAHGYLDTEADARRAAARIILAVEESGEDDQLGSENAGSARPRSAHA